MSIPPRSSSASSAGKSPAGSPEIPASRAEAASGYPDDGSADSLPPSADAWTRLAEAYRQNRNRNRTTQATRDESAPFGFAARVVAQVMEMRRHQHLAWWTRWSMAAAGAAALLAVVMAVRTSNGGGSDASALQNLLPDPPPVELPRLATP